MKIFYLGDSANIHIQRWAKYFTDNGHEVHLISQNPPSSNKLCNVPVHLLTISKPQIKFLSHFINLILGIVKMRALINKIRPDIIHGHSVTSHSIIGALTGFHPYLLTAWGTDVLIVPKKSFVHKMQTKFTMEKADIVLTISDYMRKYLIDNLSVRESKIISLPWGVDLTIFTQDYKAEVNDLKKSLKIGDDNFIILSPRHLRDHYRIQNIIYALPQIVAKYPNTILILLKGTGGESLFENQIEGLVNQLGIRQNVQLVDRFLDSHEMAILFNACDAFISVPKSDGFASCVMEGMACGAVPIVAHLDVYRQYLSEGENALFVNPDNIEDIAAKVIYCIEHRELKDIFKSINLKIIQENEDWVKNARKLEDLYQNLLNKKLELQTCDIKSPDDH